MLKKVLRPLLERFPPTAKILELRLIRYLYRNERALLDGRIPPHSDHPSIVFFTQHKCASMFTRVVIQDLGKDAGMVPIDYDAMMFNGLMTPDEVLRIFNRGDKTLFPETGFVFGPFRAYTEGIPDLDRYKVILMLRDPRDVIVSFYFSMAYSHLVPGLPSQACEVLLNERDAARAMSIDDYALEKVSVFRDIYLSYIKHLLGRPYVLFLKYEEMVTDYEAWLRRICDFPGIEPKPETWQKLLAAGDFSPRPEDPTKHRRQVLPGDHRRKLQPKTIELLNQQLADVLTPLGYA